MGFPGEQNRSQPMFGADFIAKSKRVFELGSGNIFCFRSVGIHNFIKNADRPYFPQTNSLPSPYLTYKWGNFHPDKKKKYKG
jgi:hypothetical protein